MNNISRASEMERYILEHLDEALEKGWIRVYVQPVVRTFSGQVCGLEALARWDDPVRGLLQPWQFIDVLERHRLIHKLDVYMLRRICEILGQHRGEGDVPISVNFSRLDYELCDIFQELESAVRENHVPRENLCIEITESILSENEDKMRQIIDRFRAAGYAVWMDDFGSGYSSLNVLKDFDFDELKIDMHFLSDFHAKSKKILASIVHMAKQIGIQTLAEGVETDEQFEYLRNIGCEKIQGYLFGKPMPFDVCLAHVRDNGLTWESPALRQYYDAIGDVDVLSAAPFETDPSSVVPTTGKGLNSIPLAMLELRGDDVEISYTNDAFEAFAASVDWSMVLNRTFHRDGVPLNRLSMNLSRLLEETRSKGSGRMMTVFDDEYYEVFTRRVAAHGNMACILMRMINLSQSAELEYQKKLDDGLRSLYSAYERVALLELNTSRVSLLYMDTDGEDAAPNQPLEAYMKEYTENCIYPEDRPRFRQFTQPETLSERMANEGTTCLTIHLRALAFHGAYVWKCFQLIHIRQDMYYLLTRDAATEVREIESMWNASHKYRGGITPKLLWTNVVNNSDLKFFWKDRQRRFLGVSRCFMEHYEIASPDDILGKTDEDMGWHIHPDPYRLVEESVLNEGATSRQVVGSCLVQGENRDIIASKMPLYNAQGEIVGLIGYFFQSEDSVSQNANRQARVDNLTGLLNSRGIYEDLYTYIDEYTRRNTDFVRIEVAIDDFARINKRYGYDFGDAVIHATGKALLNCCGNTATVGRSMGCYFTVLTQFESRAALDTLIKRIRDIPNTLRKVDNVPFSMFLSVGSAVFSETGDKDRQLTQAEIRRVTDDVDSISRKHLREKTTDLFRMYDDLPLPFAVFKVIEDKDGTDALMLYGNVEYCKLMKRGLETIVGRRVSQLLPELGAKWYDIAARAAIKGERVSNQPYSFMNRPMILHAHRIIGPGFCAITCQPAATDGVEDSGD